MLAEARPGLERDVDEALYYYGIRASELAQATWADYDQVGATLRVRGKGSKDRVVPFKAPKRAQIRD